MPLISGKKLSQTIREEVKQEVEILKEKGIEPGLAVILVGDDPASQIYVSSKRKTCAELGILSFEKNLPSATTQPELEAVVDQLNEDPAVHGILCQFPLPDHLDEERIIRRISPQKDVDGLHPENLGLLATGRPVFVSCTPYGVMQMLKRYQCETKGKHAVVIGRSGLVGRPLSILLSQPGVDATVTVCHSKTADLPEVTSQADILVAAVGRPEMVTADMVKEGAVVIDVGINRVEAPERPKGYRLCGDVLFEEVQNKASLITPVPGGVGPMTIAMLMVNTVQAARRKNNLPPLDGFAIS